ncbi:MAG: hypothetical protein C9356_15280 [Oleiphilus sp.]|nr:MAG: hypothetical protein C9356_15280 [Oleiphilus sp.]
MKTLIYILTIGIVGSQATNVAERLLASGVKPELLIQQDYDPASGKYQITCANLGTDQGGFSESWQTTECYKAVGRKFSGRLAFYDCTQEGLTLWCPQPY